MALSPLGRFLLLASAAVGLLACFWPSGTIHHHLPPIFKAALTSVGCPLGYEAGADVQYPDNHPPVANQAETVVPGVRIQVLAVYHNGTIWTANPQLRTVDALLVDEDGGSVLRVGSLATLLAHARRLEQETMRRKVRVELRDLAGAFLMPGLIDPHVHLLSGGLMLSHVDLAAAHSKQQLVEAVRAGGEGSGAQGWVLGGGWNEQHWGGELPDKSWLDSALGAVPVFITRMDLHCGVASSEALRLAGIGPDTPDPVGGSIGRGRDGQPNGLLRDRAMELVTRLLPQPSVEQRLDAVAKAASLALSRGITTVGDMGRLMGSDAVWSDFEEVYLPLADQWKLPLRVHAYLPLSSWARVASLVAANGYVHGSGRLFWGGVKAFADGSLGSCTALMQQPYKTCEGSEAARLLVAGAGATAEPGSEGAPGSAASGGSAAAPAEEPGSCAGSAAGPGGNCGIRLIELEELKRLVEAADKAGLQVAVHAIGDRAVDDVVRVFRRAAKARRQRKDAGGRLRPQGAPDTTPPSRPFRVEHAQHLSGPAAAARLAHPDILAVLNPQHLLDDATAAISRLGPERAAVGRAYAYGTMAQAGVALAFGSDWPVVGLEPLVGLHAAAFRAAPGQDACCSPGASSPGSIVSGCLYAAAGDPGGPAAGAEAQAQAPWPWLPEEALELEVGLVAHTRGAASALMMQDYVGALNEGMRADFVILEHSPLLGPWKCRAPRVLATFIDAKCVYGCKSQAWAAGTSA